MLSAGPDPNKEKTRVAAYIDGFNLYYALKTASRHADKNHLQAGGDFAECLGRSLYWLDIQAVVLSRLSESQECVGIGYFSAPRIVSKLDKGPVRVRQQQSNDRQRVYFEALATLPLVEIIKGWYIEKPPFVCPVDGCDGKMARFEEKGTDVNIAVRMIQDLYEDRFDCALVMSADGDLARPMECIRGYGKDVLLVLPPGRKRADKLKRFTSLPTQSLELKDLRGHVMPDEVGRPVGRPLHRPDAWKAPGRWVWDDS